MIANFGVRAGVVMLALLNFIFALLWLPRVAGLPDILGTWAGLLQDFSLLAAAVAVYAVHPLAGIAVLSGIPAALASRLPAAMMVWAGNAVNLALIGAAWVVADSIARRRKAIGQ